VAAAGGQEAVDFRAGYLPRAARDLVFAAADLLALPYRDIDMSAVLAAARGRGRAVVATAVGGLPEALAAGGGLLVPPSDPAALATGIAGLLLDPAWRGRLEAEALAAAAAWTWDDAARATEAVYADARQALRPSGVGRG
jgi:glycosyltransferase involved in cell wall biosynthesis